MVGGSQSAGIPRTPKAGPDSNAPDLAKPLECGVFRRFRGIARFQNDKMTPHLRLYFSTSPYVGGYGIMPGYFLP